MLFASLLLPLVYMSARTLSTLREAFTKLLESAVFEIGVCIMICTGGRKYRPVCVL